MTPAHPSHPTPLAFETIPIARQASAPFSLEVPERRTVAVLGDEDSGVGLLGGYALALERAPGPVLGEEVGGVALLAGCALARERPAAGRALVCGTVTAGLREPERL